jgi:hypothetical protein
VSALTGRALPFSLVDPPACRRKRADQLSRERTHARTHARIKEARKRMGMRGTKRAAHDFARPHVDGFHRLSRSGTRDRSAPAVNSGPAGRLPTRRWWERRRNLIRSTTRFPAPCNKTVCCFHANADPERQRNVGAKTAKLATRFRWPCAGKRCACAAVPQEQQLKEQGAGECSTLAQSCCRGTEQSRSAPGKKKKIGGFLFYSSTWANRQWACKRKPLEPCMPAAAATVHVSVSALGISSF